MQLDTVTDSDAFAHVIFVSVDTCASARFPADPVDALTAVRGSGGGSHKKIAPARAYAVWSVLEEMVETANLDE